MNKSYLFLIASILSLLSLAGGVSAGEETFSITVDPAKWDKVRGEYHSNITGDGWPVHFPIGENFTLTLKADNLENGTEYLFSFEIRYSSSWYHMERDQYNQSWEDRAVVTNASHYFIGNNTEEYVYNLTGQLWYNSQVDNELIVDRCTSLEARVSFVKNPNAKNDTWVLANFTSQEDFLPNGNMLFGGFYTANCVTPETITLGERVAILGLIIALPLLFLFSIYKMFKLSVQDGDDGTWAALFWLTMMVLPFLIFSYFWVVPW